MSGPLPETGTSRSPRRRVYEQLEPAARRTPGLSTLNRFLVAAILLGSMIAVFETEKSLPAWTAGIFAIGEVALGVLFAVEYLARVWVAPERHQGRWALAERLRFVFSLAGALDLIVIAATLLPTLAGSAVILRWLRLVRIFRLAKLGRASQALDHVLQAVHSRRYELGLTLAAGFVLIIAAATALHLAEGAAQPEKFGSIPRAIWWAVATLTTIGYGDVYPITPLGKVLASLTALFSIGLIAMPTGILAAAFSDGLERHRRSSSDDSA